MKCLLSVYAIENENENETDKITLFDFLIH